LVSDFFDHSDRCGIIWIWRNCRYSYRDRQGFISCVFGPFCVFFTYGPASTACIATADFVDEEAVEDLVLDLIGGETQERSFNLIRVFLI